MEGTACGSRLCRLPGTLQSKAPCSSRNQGPGPPPNPSRPSKCCSPEPVGNRCLQTFGRLVPEEQGGGTQDSTPSAQARAAWGMLRGAARATGEARGPVGRRASPRNSVAASLPARAASKAVSTLAFLSPSGPCPGCGKPAGSPSAPCSLEQPGGMQGHLVGDPAPGSPGPAAHTQRET